MVLELYFARLCADADVEGRARGTAVTRLAIVGCTEAEIAAITGHSLRGVDSILDANYLHRDSALGESAIRKLETGRPKENDHESPAPSR
jgi:hypothetical protein